MLLDRGDLAVPARASVSGASRMPVAWGFAIINFVWWIGIGHAGTLISAILLLFKQELAQLDQPLRRGDDHLCRRLRRHVSADSRRAVHGWVTGYFPYPNTMNVWPQFRSPLLWDVFAVSTYATISVVFWYIGMIPDLATLRDRSKSKVGQFFYGMIALGWRGSVRHWMRYETASLLLAGLATPLVLSVHTVISFDFAVALLPGWHTTIFPPYFVAGAVYSGFAMVITLAVPIRKFYHLEDIITIRHIDNMGKVMLVTGLIVAYGYGMEVFMSWYSASHWEYFMMWNRMFGPMGWSYWVLITCNIALPQLMWLRKFRTNVGAHVHHVLHRQYRHVVRAFRHHRDQPYSRLTCPRRGAPTRRRAGITRPLSERWACSHSCFSCSFAFCP